MAEKKLSDLQARIAGRIIEQAIETDLKPGAHMNELALAEQFGVSRSPVSAALSFLATRGLVEARPNQGYFLKAGAARLRASRSGLPDTANDRLYETIIGDRVAGRLQESPSEAELMRRYDVSRGVLRRVLQRLAEEDIVERSEGYGWNFRPSLDTVEAHDESYFFRMTIEPAGILAPTFRPDLRRLQALRVVHEQMLDAAGRRVTRLRWFEMNSDFHSTIAEWSRNRFILQAIQQQNRLRRLLEFKGFVEGERALASCREHLEVLMAVEQGDRAWAAQLMTRHLSVASKLKLAFADV